MLMRTTRLPALAALGLLSLAPDLARAQTITSETDGTVSVTAQGTTVQDVLSAFSRLVPMWIRLDPAVAGQPVTAEVRAASAADALSLVLKASGVDFALARGRAGDRLRVVVGDSNAPAWTPPGSSDAAGNPGAAADASTPAASAADALASETAREAAVAAEAAAQTGAPPEGVGDASDASQNTPARLSQLLVSQPRRAPQPFEAVPVPFPSADGQPYTAQAVPSTPGTVRVPFPSADGSPLEVPVTAPPPGWVRVPFPGPDGQPLLIPISGGAAPAASPTPGGGTTTAPQPNAGAGTVR